MVKRTAAKKVKKESDQPPKRGRADHEDHLTVAARAGEPIELDGNSQTSDQQPGTMREQEIPGPSRTSHREKLTTEVDNYLKNWFDKIDDLTETLEKDRQSKTSLSANKEILDKNLKEVTKRIHENERKLETAKYRVMMFEANYKKVAKGKVSDYWCAVCKEICGITDQKYMVRITMCGHRFCKECVFSQGKGSSFRIVRNNNNSHN